MADNLPKYPPVHEKDVEIIRAADPEVLAAVHRLLFSGHAGGVCESDPAEYCYRGACLKFSALIKAVDGERGQTIEKTDWRPRNA
jgi:hypothetical protein